MPDDILKYLESRKPEIEEAIKKILPQSLDEDYVKWAFGKPRFEYDVESLNSALSEPVWDLLNRGGKRWRPVLFLLIGEMLGVEREKLMEFAALPELVHNGCLPADTRVHKNPGENPPINTINKGDFVYCLSKDGKLDRKMVLAKKMTGKKKVYTLKTRNRELRATDNHPFLVVEKHQPFRYKITKKAKHKLMKNLERGDLKRASEELGISYGVLTNGLSPTMKSSLLEKNTLEYIFSFAGISLKSEDYSEKQTKYESPDIALKWKSLKGLEKGDLIVTLRKGKDRGVPYKLPVPHKNPPKDRTVIPEYTTSDFCQLIGYILGDGSVNIQKRYSTLILSPSKDEIEKKRYISIFKKTFGYKLKRETNNGYERMTCCSYKICWLLDQLGLNKKSIEKGVPEWVFSLPEEQKLAFLRGYLDSDGSVAKNGIVSFACASEKLIRDLKILIDGLGFTAGNLSHRKVKNLWKNSIKKESDQWHISVSSPNKVLKKIGSEKPEYRKRLGQKKTRKSPDFKYQEKYPNVPIDMDSFRLDRVNSIIPGSVEPVYDLTIQDSHNFIANNVVVHNSLIVDDIEDLGELRRGKPCTHKLFGQDVAINAGNFLYFVPALAMIKSKSFDDKTLVRAYGAYIQEMMNIHLGQGLDIWWHKGGKLDVTEEQYLQMCAYKTGTLARLSARLAAILGGASEETEALLGRLAESLGVGFQIQDDVLSASGRGFQEKKGYGDDITEGKRTLIVIHALKHAPEEERKEILDILGKHTRDPKMITRALDILDKSGSVDYARDFASRLIKDAWKEAEPKLPDNPAKETLERFLQFAITRKI